MNTHPYQFKAWSLWLYFDFRESHALQPHVTGTKLLCYPKQSRPRCHSQALTWVPLCAISTSACLAKGMWELPRAHVLPGHRARPCTLFPGICGYVTLCIPSLPWGSLISSSNLCPSVNKEEMVSHHGEVTLLHDPGHQFWLKEQVWI